MDAEARLFASPAPGPSVSRTHVPQVRRAEEHQHRGVVGPAVDDSVSGERRQAITEEIGQQPLFLLHQLSALLFKAPVVAESGARKNFDTDKRKREWASLSAAVERTRLCSSTC